jgi:hypothetical protein
MGIPEQSVWIFLGDRARWPSGVFSSRESAVRWVAGHCLTGVITEYPVDVGVATGTFRPSKPLPVGSRTAGSAVASRLDGTRKSRSLG